jgi:transcriptional regulator with AAA-type ATPase domain
VPTSSDSSTPFPHAVGTAHPDPQSPALPRRLSGRPLDALRTQRAAVQRIEEALVAGHARVLLVGPTGSGKSTWLRHWAERGLGKAWEGTGALPEGGALLVDDVDRLEAPARRMLARALPSRPVVLALDATLPAPGKEIDGRRHGSRRRLGRR